MPYHWKTWLIAGLAPLALPGSAWAINIDGIVSPSDNYQRIFSVTYQLADLSYLHGGTLALGEDADGFQYMYFSAPKTFVDNSFGVNAIGWEAVSGHTFKDLLNSDKAVFTFATTQGNSTATFDYLAKDQNGNYASCGIKTGRGAAYPNQCEGVGDSIAQNVIVDIATSLEYNINTYGFRTTPATKKNADPEPYSPYADSDYGNVEAGYENWVFDLAYEIKFDQGTFNSADWLSANPDVIASIITFDEPHASPSKFPGSSFPKAVCIGGAVGCPAPPSPVPAPGALALMLIGLAGLGLRGRRAGPVAT